MTGDLKPQLTDGQMQLAISQTVLPPIFDYALVIAGVGDKKVMCLFARGSSTYKGKKIPEKQIELLEASLKSARAYLEELSVKE